jgi:hypothetical protein
MITELTREQEQSLPEFRDLWLNIGLSTEPLNPAKVLEAVALAYTLAGLRPPQFALFARGPREAMQFIAAATRSALTMDEVEQAAAQGVIGLTDALRSVIRESGDDSYQFVRPSFYGQHEAGWFSFHDFFNQQFGLSERGRGLRELAKQAGWVWMYEDLVVVSERPLRVSMANGVLHDEHRAAVEYADGTRVYAVRGVIVPERWVVERECMDPAEIFECTLTDVRAAGIALFGYARLKQQLRYRIVEGDPSTDIGALVEITLPGLSRPGRFLEAECPRNGPVWLGVPECNPWDNNRPILSAVGAQAFLARLPESAYAHPPIRT